MQYGCCLRILLGRNVCLNEITECGHFISGNFGEVVPIEKCLNDTRSTDCDICLARRSPTIMTCIEIYKFLTVSSNNVRFIINISLDK